jgi:hypothetical protein
MTDNHLRDQARKRLKAKADFWTYLGVWLGVSLLLTGIWYFTEPTSYFWPGWAIGGMGVAAFFVGLDAYGPGRRVITDEAIDEEIRKMTKNAPRP